MYWSPEGSYLATLEEDGMLKVSCIYNLVNLLTIDWEILCYV